MKKYLSLLVGLALMVPAAAGAAQFSSGEAVALGETVRENVYTVGGTVTITGTIEGDLYVGGGTVNLAGTVTKDVVVVGGTLIVSGKIGEDLRALGGNVTIGGSIGGELAAAGGNLTVLQDATVAGQVAVAGGNLNLAGTYGKGLIAAGDQIVLAEGLKVSGNFDYYAQKEAKIGQGAAISGVTTFHKQEIKTATKKSGIEFFSFITFWSLISLAAAIIISWLLFYLWPKDSREMIEKVFATPGKELVRGFVVLFILPIAAIVSMITVIGLPIGFFLIFAFLTLFVLGAAMTGLIWAGILARYFMKRKETEINWWLIALGAVTLGIIKLIPVVGWVVGFLVFLTGFGVMSHTLYLKLAPKK